MFSRLFSRFFRRNDSGSTGRVDADSVVFLGTTTDSTANLHRQSDYHHLLQVLARNRVRSSSDRVACAIRLVDALRRFDVLDSSTQPLHLVIALALRDLDELIDSMTYEELLEAFGDRNSSRGLSEIQIKAIPSQKLTTSDDAVLVLPHRAVSCPVCLDNFQSDEILKTLPSCCHSFHGKCIDVWLKRRPTCPVCRKSVLSVINKSVEVHQIDGESVSHQST